MKKYIVAAKDTHIVLGVMHSELSLNEIVVDPMSGVYPVVELIDSMEVPHGKMWKDGQFIDPPEALDDEQKASRVMFRALAMTEVIASADALDNAIMFPRWSDCIGQRAEAGSYWRHNDKLWRVNAGQGHIIQADWAPDKAPSMFSLAANPAEAWPEWIQPTGAHNAYAKGAQVSYQGKKWWSNVDGNVWAPGVYGWEEVKG